MSEEIHEGSGTNNPERQRLTLARINESAKLGLQVMTGREVVESEIPPREIRWQHPNLGVYFRAIVDNPQNEHALSVGYADPVRLDGSDSLVVAGLEGQVGFWPKDFWEKERGKIYVHPLINVHSHPVPVQANVAEPWFAFTNSPLRFWEYKEEEKVRPFGIAGVTYPTGIDDLYWTDIYLMPKTLSVTKAISDELKAIDWDQVSLTKVAFLAQIIPKRFGSAGRKLFDSIAAETNSYFMAGAAQKRRIQNVFYRRNQLRRTRVDRLCQEMGIIQYRAATTETEIRSGCETLNLKLLDQ